MWLHYGQLPLQFRLFKHVVQFWNSLLQLDADIIAQVCRLACSTAESYDQSWLAQLLRACNVVVVRGAAGTLTSTEMSVPAAISWQPLARALCLYYKLHLQQQFCSLLPDHPDCPHRKHSVVCQWLNPVRGTWLYASPVLGMLDVDCKKQHTVAKFLCGLACVSTAHHSMLSSPYSQRCGHMCGHEQHVLLQCPAIQHLCVQYSQLQLHFQASSLPLFLAVHHHLPHIYHFIAGVMAFAVSVPSNPP